MKQRCTLATMYGVGLVGIVPGTAGSFVAALLALAILHLPYGWGALALGAVAFSWLGTRSATRYMQAHGTAHDPKEIVVDELAGQWLTYVLAPLVLMVVQPGNALLAHLGLTEFLLLHTAIGFILFRLFDIVKPWPISLADRKVKGGFGVMFDDLLAAIPAGILLYYADMYALRLMLEQQ